MRQFIFSTLKFYMNFNHNSFCRCRKLEIVLNENNVILFADIFGGVAIYVL